MPKVFQFVLEQFGKALPHETVNSFADTLFVSCSLKTPQSPAHAVSPRQTVRSFFCCGNVYLIKCLPLEKERPPGASHEHTNGPYEMDHFRLCLLCNRAVSAGDKKRPDRCAGSATVLARAKSSPCALQQLLGRRRRK